MVFTGAAQTCTEFERYRTQSEFDDALVLKMFIFELFNQCVVPTDNPALSARRTHRFLAAHAQVWCSLLHQLHQGEHVRL